MTIKSYLRVSLGLHQDKYTSLQHPTMTVNQTMFLNNKLNLTKSLHILTRKVRSLRGALERSINRWTGTPYMLRGSVSSRNRSSCIGYRTLSHPSAIYNDDQRALKNRQSFLKRHTRHTRPHGHNVDTIMLTQCSRKRLACCV